MIRAFMKSKVYGSKVSAFGPTLTPCLPLKMGEIEKNRHQWGKTSAIGLSKSVKIKASSLHLISPFRGNTITFCNIWDIKETWRGYKSKGQNQRSNLRNSISSKQFLTNFPQKILVATFSSFVAIDHKSHFRKILTRIFKFACFFLLPRLHF